MFPIAFCFRILQILIVHQRDNIDTKMYGPQYDCTIITVSKCGSQGNEDNVTLLSLVVF